MLPSVHLVAQPLVGVTGARGDAHKRLRYWGPVIVGCTLLKLLLPCALLLSLLSTAATSADHRARFCGFGGDGELLTGLHTRWPTLEYCRAYADSEVPR